MSEFPYLYRNSFKEAQRFNEVGKWRSSHLENIRCCKDIEAVISAGSDGEHLGEDCAQSVLDRHGFKRVQHVLANSVHELRCAGQMDKELMQWLRQIYVPRDKKRDPEFAVQTAPAVLNLFTRQVHQAYQALGLFGPEHCTGDRNGLDYTGKVLVISPDVLREECWDARNMLWLVI